MLVEGALELMTVLANRYRASGVAQSRAKTFEEVRAQTQMQVTYLAQRLF